MYGADPVDRAVLEELFELARWAPNHHLTNPWRFRVVGPEALERLKAAEGDFVAAKKLDRAPTLVAVSSVSADGATDAERQEDLMASACAAYVVLLAATELGLANYWRTPGRPDRGLMDAQPSELADDEQIVGLLHLGSVRQEAQPRSGPRWRRSALSRLGGDVA